MAAAQDQDTLAAILLAIVPVILGAVALTWSVSTYLLTGSRVRVRLWDARIGPTGAIRLPLGHGDEVGAPPQEFPRSGMALSAQNVGRLPVSIMDLTVSLKPSGMVWQSGTQPERAQGSRLETGAEKTWYFTLDDLRAMLADAHQGPQRAEVRLDLGNGKQVKAREKLTVVPDPPVEN